MVYILWRFTTLFTFFPSQLYRRLFKHIYKVFFLKFQFYLFFFYKKYYPSYFARFSSFHPFFFFYFSIIHLALYTLWPRYLCRVRLINIYERPFLPTHLCVCVCVCVVAGALASARDFVNKTKRKRNKISIYLCVYKCICRPSLLLNSPSDQRSTNTITISPLSLSAY